MTAMDCREALLLISPHLDGALTMEEEAALAGHTGSCRACAAELALQEKLSAALREFGRLEAQAPPELCGLVMSRLRAERKTALARLPAAWRKALAAAAAVLLITCGTATGLKIAGGGKMIGLGTPAKVEGPGSPAGLINGGGPAGPSGEATAPGTGNAQEGNTPYDNGGNGPGSPLTAAGGPAGIEPGAEGTADAPPAGVSSVPAEGPRVLLSSGVKVTSTILKTAVEDLTEARAKAVALAAGAEASTQVFREQAGGRKIIVLRMAVAAGRAPDLIAGLYGIGNVIDRQDESRDITPLYNETLVQYNDLISRKNSAVDAEEQRRLEAQAMSYRQQLDAWEAEAGKRIITLWLESK